MMEVVNTCNITFFQCPLLPINEIISFIATRAIYNNTFIDHVDIIYKMIRCGIPDLDGLCL